MITQSQNKARTSPLPFYIIGVILMFGGMLISQNYHPDFLTQLEKTGILLDPGKTVAVIGVFLILFQVMNLFFIRPLDEVIQARTANLEATFSEAEALREQMRLMKAEYEQRLTATEAGAREQIQAQIKEAQDLKKSLMADASARAEDLVKKASEEIAAEKKQVLTDLRVHVAGLSLQASEKILSENMDNARNRRLIDEFLTKVEVKN